MLDAMKVHKCVSHRLNLPEAQFGVREKEYAHKHVYEP